VGTTLERENTGNLDYLFQKKKIKQKIVIFRKQIISWYLKNGRVFPWRTSNATDYDKFIAEILLQKTRAENIINVYLEFLDMYPDFYTLSDAKPSTVEDIIKPLGLSKNRSQTLTKCAKEIVNNHAGKIPSKREDLLKLPGIGIYTVNAYLISEYELKLAVIDTNFKRVFNRFFHVSMDGDPRRNPFLLKFAEFLLPETHIKEYTFGVIDFAALVCKNKNPKCKICILKKNCDYYTNKN
jgi:A/G-specific adenine glycosylase